MLMRAFRAILCFVFGHTPSEVTGQPEIFEQDKCSRCGCDIWAMVVSDRDGEWSWYVDKRSEL